MFSSQYACLMWYIVKSKQSVSLNTLSGLSFSEDFSAEASNSFSFEGSHQCAHAVQHHVGAIAQLRCFEFHATYALNDQVLARDLAPVFAVCIGWL